MLRDDYSAGLHRVDVDAEESNRGTTILRILYPAETIETNDSTPANTQH